MKEDEGQAPLVFFSHRLDREKTPMPRGALDRFRLDGKTVLLTGASSGLGHHFAGTLAEAGARVVLGARRQERIEARAEEIRTTGGEAIALPLDVREAESIEAFFDAGEAAFGRIDVLINNAGIEAGVKTYTMVDEEDWDSVLDTNLKAPWLCSKTLTQRIVERGWDGASIVNIASITASRGTKGIFPYAVSKAGLVRATEVMALEGARYGIRVNAIAPGYFLSDVSRVLLEGPTSEAFRKRIPMRRFGDYPEFDGALLLLASDASSYMTGSVVVVDGGHLCAEL
jgi:NAD(P)-dependent dehydrogenase (short-subunit alcohol dehydrogenase family)